MKKKLIALLLLPLVALSQAGDWAMDFDEDWAAAGGAKRWTPAELSPLVWLKGDGTANDSSGNGNHGYWEGTASYTNGVNGSAFTGFSAANWVSSEEGMFHSMTNTRGLTVCAWMKPYGYVYYGWSFGLSYLQDIIHVNLTAEPYYTTFSVSGQVLVGAMLLPGETGHLVVTRSNKVVQAYFNGALVYTHAYSAFDNYTAATNAPMAVGRGITSVGGAFSPAFNGFVDDFMVFDRPISGAEVEQIYNWRE